MVADTQALELGPSVSCSFGSTGRAQTDRCACVRQMKWRGPASGSGFAPAALRTSVRQPFREDFGLSDGGFGLQRLIDLWR